MKILMLSKALVVGAYQKKAEELAALPGVELTVAVPPSWREPGAAEQRLERRFTSGYDLAVLPVWLNGRHHSHFYPALERLVAAVRPDVFHIDEESFNLATFLSIRAGVRHGARCCFYNWANIDRRYPPPFGFFERYAFRHAAHAIAGNQEAADIIRRHGYAGPIAVLPQFGVDPDIFSPGDQRPKSKDQSAINDASSSVLGASSFVVGYLGRLLPQKGVLDLVAALARLPEHVGLRLIGEGALRPRILSQAAELRRLDALALPSRTTRSWKEQFGRVLPEAMSCGVPVIGSSSGEIPRVIGDAGLIFPEGDIVALSGAIRRLADDAALRAELNRRGRARVLERYTQAALARQYYKVYHAMADKDWAV